MYWLVVFHIMNHQCKIMNHLIYKKNEKSITVQEKMQYWKTQYRWTDPSSVFEEAVVRSTQLKLTNRITEKLIIFHKKLQCWKT